LEEHPEVPPGADRPGLRERLARVAVDVRPLRESRPFRRLWLGQTISYLGGQFTAVAVPYQVYQLTGSTLAVALISFVELVPLLTLTLLGGAIADAVDRRRLLLWTEAGLTVTGLGFVANAALAEPLVWPLYLLGFLSASFFCLGVGAMRSLTPHLVREDQIAAASALNSLQHNFGAVAGPALAGIVIASIGLSATSAAAPAACSRRRRRRPGRNSSSSCSAGSRSTSRRCARLRTSAGSGWRRRSPSWAARSGSSRSRTRSTS
jgi:MFS family permease